MVRSLALAVLSGSLCLGIAWREDAVAQTRSRAPVLDAVAVESAELPSTGGAPGRTGEKTPKQARTDTPDPLLVRAQVLLLRARFSPGEIDGRPGDNFKKALRAFAQSAGVASDGTLTPALWERLKASSSEPVLIEQPVTAAYLAGPFLDAMPKRLDDMEGLPAMSYGGVEERISETFHLSPALLRGLNRAASFRKEGEVILVPNVARKEKPGTVARIEVDKAQQTVRAFDAAGALLAFYPATVGSDEKPTPNGDRKVVAVTRDPWYRYNPEYRFKGVKATKPFKIAPGPNNPVGLVWIALSEKGYGIHGTPEPSRISKSASNGCVRLTNWDALALASMVDKGVTVTFVDEGAAALAQDVSGSRTRRR